MVKSTVWTLTIAFQAYSTSSRSPYICIQDKAGTTLKLHLQPCLSPQIQAILPRNNRCNIQLVIPPSLPKSFLLICAHLFIFLVDISLISEQVNLGCLTLYTQVMTILALEALGALTMPAGKEGQL